jgi:hypothetical protein
MRVIMAVIQIVQLAVIHLVVVHVVQIVCQVAMGRQQSKIN